MKGIAEHIVVINKGQRYFCCFFSLINNNINYRHHNNVSHTDYIGMMAQRSDWTLDSLNLPLFIIIVLSSSLPSVGTEANYP